MTKKRLNKIKPNEHLKEYLKTTPLQRLEWLEQANKFVYENHLAKIGTKPACAERPVCRAEHDTGRSAAGRPAPLKVSERAKQK